MTKRNDISVPEGYFQNLEQRLSRIPDRQQKTQAPRGIRVLTPYMAYAASLLLLVAVGNWVFRGTAATENGEIGWDYVSYLAQSLDPDGLVELKEASELSEEDIENYLLADNVSVELLSVLNYEEDD